MVNRGDHICGFYCKGTADWLIEAITFVGVTVKVQLTG